MTATLLVPITVWILNQLLKAALARRRRPTLRDFLVSGGMPSAHTAMAASLSTIVGLRSGWGSELFAVTAIFAAIVAYDAMGVRRASGDQARLVNRLVDRVVGGGRSDFERLREELGHRPVEVAAGVAFGVVMTVVIQQLFL